MLRLILALPLIVILVIFALSNRAPVSIGFLGYTLVAPLSVAMLIGAAVFFVFGALIIWFGEMRQRARARRAERRVRQLEAEIATLEAANARAIPVPVETRHLVPAS